ncbi:MAG: MSCRAMM family adhesin SdrC, partial [Deltaproteobacteria bacterium]|nr:MSCRAMM family adhesin SdrC [Deltaproteobacteria bacterium]
TNGNGVQDSSENGLSGIDISISVDFDGDGIPDYTAATTTDANGNYSFDNLPAGEYSVSVDTTSLPGDVRPSGDPDATLDNTSTVNLGPSQINNEQDFGYTGTGSIGDTVYYDADGNGFQSPGERGLGGVTVTLQGDFDNDGTIEAVTTTTDANGTYLFDNLTAGAYTVYVDTTTLPGGLTQTGDPDAILDNQSTVALSAGEANLAQDFGYGGPSPFPPTLPPQPEIPVVPVTPPSSPPSPSPLPIALPDQGLVADAFFMYRQFGERIDSEIFNQEETLPWQPPIHPVSPMYTGHTEPGTTIQLILYDALGNQIGYESIMADTAGNWMADFPETIMYELPHRMEIVQTMSSYNASSAGFFNMRTYFTPSFSSMIYAHTRLDVEAVFAYLPSTLIESVHHSNLSPFDIKWNDFNGYEFVAPSTNPAQNSH